MATAAVALHFVTVSVIGCNRNGQDDQAPTEELPTVPEPPADFVERGQWQFERLACASCHGEAGAGGIANPNYLQDTTPALDVMAERLGLFEPEEAAIAIELLENGTDLATIDPAPFRAFARFAAQVDSVRTVIRDGATPGKADADGPEPQAMPGWGPILGDDVDAVIAYLISVYSWEQQ